MAEELPVFQFRNLYFDTNVFLGAGWPGVSAKLQRVLTLARSVNVSVYLPDAVERELESHWLREYEQKRGKVQDHLEPIRKWLARLPVTELAVTVPELNQVQGSYRESVVELKQTWGILSAPIPDIATADLFDLAISQEVAFEDQGKNFQDTIIYLSALNHLRSDPERLGAFVSADGVFERRKLALEKLALDRDLEMRIYSDLDQIANELLSREGVTLRHSIEADMQRSLEGLHRDQSKLQQWLNQNVDAIRGLRQRYPATAYFLVVNRVVTASPAIGPAHQIDDRVRIACEVEVQINGFSFQTSNRASAFPLPRYGQLAYPSLYPEAYPDTELTPEPQRVQFGLERIEVDAEATFTEEGYSDFLFRTARVRMDPPPR